MLIRHKSQGAEIQRDEQRDLIGEAKKKMFQMQIGTNVRKIYKPVKRDTVK